MTGLIAALILVQAPTTSVDEGTLAIRVDTQEVARETFRLIAKHVGDSTTGWVLAATTHWVSGGRPLVLGPVLELTPDSQPGTLTYAVGLDGTSQRIIGQPGPGRYTLRYIAPGLERARELAFGPRSVVLDDSVFAPFLFAAWRATPTPTPVTAIVLRAPRRQLLTVTDLGMAVTTLNRDQATLRHILIEGGSEGPVHVWLSPDAHLMKVEIPGRGLRAERLPG